MVWEILVGVLNVAGASAQCGSVANCLHRSMWHCTSARSARLASSRQRTSILGRGLGHFPWNAAYEKPIGAPADGSVDVVQSDGSGSTSSMVQLLSELRLATSVQLPELTFKLPPAQMPPTQPVPDESTWKVLLVL